LVGSKRNFGIAESKPKKEYVLKYKATEPP
jgi:hypothetical protein